MISEPLLLLVLITGFLAVLAIVFRPEWGLLALVFLIFTRLSDVFVNSHNLPSIAKLFIPLLLVIILIRWFVFRQKPENWKGAAFLLVGYGLIGFFSLLFAADASRVQEALITFLKDALILLIIVILLTRGDTLRSVIWTLLAAGIFIGTLNTYQYLTGTFGNDYWGFAEASFSTISGGTEDYRVSGPVGLGPNGFGRYLLLIVPLALDRLWNERQAALRFLAAWALVVAVLSVFFTFSRGSFLGLISVFAVMFIYRPPRLHILVITVLIGIILFQFIPGTYAARLLELTDLLPGQTEYGAEGNVSFRGRLSENKSAWMMFLDNPMFGVGLSNYKVHYQEYSQDLGLDPRREERSPHSFYLEIMSELGTIGLLWFIALQWITFKSVFQARRDLLAAGMTDYAGICVAIIAALVGFLVTGIFLHVAQPRFFWLLYGIALALPQIADNEHHFATSFRKKFSTSPLSTLR